MFSRAAALAVCLALAAAKSDRVFRSGCSREVKGCQGTELSCWNGDLDPETGVCTFFDKTQCYTCGKVDGLDKCECSTPPVYGALESELGDAVSTKLTCNKVESVLGSGIGSGLTPTTSNSGTTMTIGTYNGMYGWIDIDDSRFYGFTEFLLGLVATVPSMYTREGFRVVYDCNSGGLAGSMPTDFDGCNIFLFSYRCPPCDSRSGALGSYILAYDEDDTKFYAGNCGPTFKLNKDLGVEHQFAVYSAEMPAEARVKLTLPNDVQFMFWALVGKSVVCQSMTDETECGNFPINCRWVDDTCRPNVCPKPTSMYHGPPQSRCEVCVDDEEDFIPEVTDIL